MDYACEPVLPGEPLPEVWQAAAPPGPGVGAKFSSGRTSLWIALKDLATEKKTDVPSTRSLPRGLHWLEQSLAGARSLEFRMCLPCGGSGLQVLPPQEH